MSRHFAEVAKATLEHCDLETHKGQCFHTDQLCEQWRGDGFWVAWARPVKKEHFPSHICLHNIFCSHFDSVAHHLMFTIYCRHSQAALKYGSPSPVADDKSPIHQSGQLPWETGRPESNCNCGVKKHNITISQQVKWMLLICILLHHEYVQCSISWTNFSNQASIMWGGHFKLDSHRYMRLIVQQHENSVRCVP